MLLRLHTPHAVLLAVLAGLPSCAHPPPPQPVIVLHRPVPRRPLPVPPHVPAAPAEACVIPQAGRISPLRKAELFAQFAALQNGAAPPGPGRPGPGTPLPAQCGPAP